MKPSWDDAPEWANWLAMDKDGCWWWYEKEPEFNDATGYWDINHAEDKCKCYGDIESKAYRNNFV